MPSRLQEDAYSWQVSSTSLFIVLKSFFDFNRGGVAVVWLGVKDGVDYAMKQFPKSGSGSMKFDPSAYVELQMAQLIRAYSTPEE